MDLATLDQIQLNFNPTGIAIINGAIALMMLGVALDLKFEDFKRIITNPKAPLIGLTAQFILLPAFTFLLVLIIKPLPSVALGMMLVAACPGGNLSNIITYLANGNSAISISMTAVSTLAAIVMTPFNITFWGSMYPETAAILKQVSLNPMTVFTTIVLILGLPLVVGMSISKYKPNLAQKVRKPFKIFSLVFFVIIVCGALAANWKQFIDYVGIVMIAVFIHNLLALNIGYWSGRLLRLGEKDCRAISIEVGIQNSALGLVLVFSFFDGLGGMAVLVAWWGIWHIIAGLGAAAFFNLKKLPDNNINNKSNQTA